jgi:hypothetical protein
VKRGNIGRINISQSYAQGSGGTSNSGPSDF